MSSIYDAAATVQDDHGTAVDVALGGLPYEERLVERAAERRLLAGHPPLRLCGAT